MRMIYRGYYFVPAICHETVIMSLMKKKQRLASIMMSDIKFDSACITIENKSI